MSWLTERRRARDLELDPVEPLVLPPPQNPDFYDPAWDAWKPPRKIQPKFLIAIVIVLIVVIGGLYLFQGTKSNTSSQAKSVVFATPTTFTIAHGVGQATDVTFSGSGNVTTAPFAAGAGLGVVGATCQCTSLLTVKVVDKTGATVATPINFVSSGHGFSGSAPWQSPGGTFQVKVAASGVWKVTLAFPSGVPPVSLPYPFGSSGPSVFGPFPGGKSIPIFYSFAGTVNPPAQLQIVRLDGTPGAVLFSASVLPTVKEMVIPPQPTDFYLSMSNAYQGWEVVAEAPK